MNAEVREPILLTSEEDVAVAGFGVAVAHLAWRYRATGESADRALAG